MGNHCLMLSSGSTRLRFIMHDGLFSPSSIDTQLWTQRHAVVAKLAAEDGLQQLRGEELVHDLLDLGRKLVMAKDFPKKHGLLSG